MYRIEAQNVLGVKDAVLRITPGSVKGIIGANASGKTSAAVVLQALLAREGNPLGVQAGRIAPTYTHGYGGDPSAKLIDAEGVITEWLPATAKFIAPGTPALCSREAVGLVDFTANHSAKERAMLLHGALLPPLDVVLGQAREELKSYLNEEDLTGTLREVESRGWDMAGQFYQQRALHGKREWAEITGKRWGVNVGADWRPTGWLAEYDNLTVQAAEALVTDARERLNGLHVANAVSQSDADAAEAANIIKPQLEAEVERCESVLAQLRATLAERESVLSGAVKAKEKAAAAQLSNEAMKKCPHCGGRLRVDGDGQIVKAGVPQDSVELGRALSEAKEALGKAGGERNSAHVAAVEAEEKLNEAKTALAVCKNTIKRGTGTVAENESAVLEGEAEVESARGVVQLINTKLAAEKMHASIVHYGAVAKVLGPSGVRGKLLGGGLKTLNAGYAKLAALTGWPVMQADASGTILWGDRDVRACSESEKWRAQALTQLTLAAITKAPVVVLDRADVLDTEGRTAVGKALRAVAAAAGMAIVCCFTFTGPAEEALKLCDETALAISGEITGAQA